VARRRGEKMHELRYGILQALPQAEPPHGGARRPRIEIYDMPSVRRSSVRSFVSVILAGIRRSSIRSRVISYFVFHFATFTRNAAAVSILPYYYYFIFFVT